MATYGWGTQHAVADWLFAEAYRFDFYQAVALLERLYPERVPVGEGEDRARKSYTLHVHGCLGLSGERCGGCKPSSG